MKTFLFVSAGLWSLLAVCAKGNKSTAPSGGKPPADFALTFGEGGGFTGRWQGYTIQAEGSIYAWQGKMAGDHAILSGKLTEEQMRLLWRELEKEKFFEQELDQRGNMTAILRVTASGKTKELAWVPQYGSATVAKSTPQRLQQYCQQLVQQAVEK